jgi:nucleoside-diphosphate-sugar epimerase
MALIAVTGGSGYLGAAVVEALSTIEGCRLRLLVREPIRRAEAEIVVGDVTDPEACRRLVNGADAVVHAAGLVRSTDEDALQRVNVEATAMLGHAARGECARFVHVSSTGVYGHPGTAVDEDAPMRPSNPYERSKARAEDVLRDAWPSGAVIVRPSNIVGVGHPLHPLRRFLARVHKGRPILHAGAWTNYVAVADVARVVAAAATVPDVPPVVVTNVATPMDDFVTTAGRALGRAGRTGALPPWVGQLGRPVLSALAERIPPLERVRALVDATRYRTVHQDWFDEHGLRLALEPVLRDLAAEYGLNGPR